MKNLLVKLLLDLSTEVLKSGLAKNLGKKLGGDLNKIIKGGITYKSERKLLYQELREKFTFNKLNDVTEFRESIQIMVQVVRTLKYEVESGFVRRHSPLDLPIPKEYKNWHVLYLETNLVYLTKIHEELHIILANNDYKSPLFKGHDHIIKELKLADKGEVLSFLKDLEHDIKIWRNFKEYVIGEYSRGIFSEYQPPKDFRVTLITMGAEVGKVVPFVGPI